MTLNSKLHTFDDFKCCTKIRYALKSFGEQRMRTVISASLFLSHIVRSNQSSRLNQLFVDGVEQFLTVSRAVNKSKIRQIFYAPVSLNVASDVKSTYNPKLFSEFFYNSEFAPKTFFWEVDARFQNRSHIKVDDCMLMYPVFCVKFWRLLISRFNLRKKPF